MNKLPAETSSVLRPHSPKDPHVVLYTLANIASLKRGVACLSFLL